MAYPFYQPQQIQSYFPASYQPMQPQQIQPQQTSIIWVSGEREAQMYPVAPNAAVTLWSQTEPVVFLKQTDAAGRPTMKIYDLVERSQTAPAESQTKATDYASKDDLSALESALRGLAADIDQIRVDMYGIAGKKKPVKKMEVEDAE